MHTNSLLREKTTGTNTHESLLSSAIMLKVAQFNIALVCLTFSIGLNIITSPRSKSRSRTERFSGGEPASNKNTTVERVFSPYYLANYVLLIGGRSVIIISIILRWWEDIAAIWISPRSWVKPQEKV